MKRILVALVVALSVVSLVGCGSGSSTTMTTKK
jgi:predicted small lipoprotein YifL